MYVYIRRLVSLSLPDLESNFLRSEIRLSDDFSSAPSLHRCVKGNV